MMLASRFALLLALATMACGGGDEPTAGGEARSGGVGASGDSGGSAQAGGKSAGQAGGAGVGTGQGGNSSKAGGAGESSQGGGETAGGGAGASQAGGGGQGGAGAGGKSAGGGTGQAGGGGASTGGKGGASGATGGGGEVSCTPSDEVCDGIDNDCNGLVDEGDPEGGALCNLTEGLGECALGVLSCKKGELTCMQTAFASPEICDGLDNDCNGAIDDLPELGIPCCPPGVPCGIGACAAGELQCDAQTGELVCKGGKGPVAEACGDGLDNDCDGSVDDGCSCAGAVSCETACGSGAQACEGGVLAGCDAPVPSLEVCDGVDNDCSGEVDDLPGRGGACCPAGVPCGIGVCSYGKLDCAGSPSLSCVGAKVPSAEQCNGQDDDCDGQIDEGDVCCEGGAGQPCSTGLAGRCSEGQRACDGSCIQMHVASPEQCNGQDDDCDGQVDEGDVCCSTPGCCDPSLGQACQTGKQGICNAGVVQCNGSCAQVSQPQAESCNGKDDDCDGQTDEGDVCCNVNVGKACPTGKLGDCAAGTTQCDGSCTQNEQPEAESCDGRDNDCDGQIDEDGVCCAPGTGTPCDTGQQGICGPGTRQCDGSCAAQSGPQGESCNGQDDDCDGQVDEDGVCCNAQQGQACDTGAPGVCGPGTVQCDGSCAANQGSSPEVCGDGLDNDCDGAVDNGCLPPGSCGFGDCVPMCGGMINLPFWVVDRDCWPDPECCESFCTLWVHCRCNGADCAPSCSDTPYLENLGPVGQIQFACW